MDPSDLAEVDAWFAIFSANSFTMGSKELQAESRALENGLDWNRITRDILTHVLARLGGEASNWYSEVDEYRHPYVFPPAAVSLSSSDSFDDAKARFQAITLELPDVLALPDSWKFFFIPCQEDAQEFYGKNQSGNQNLSGPLPALLDHLDAVCKCWIPDYVTRGLIRSGNYLRAGRERQPAVDMTLCDGIAHGDEIDHALPADGDKLLVSLRL